jgi:hypothetical protein
MSILSSEELGDYGLGSPQSYGVKGQARSVDTPMPYTKGTRTSTGRTTTWTRQPGMGISKQSQGSFLSFDEDTPTAPPSPDKGASFGK